MAPTEINNCITDKDIADVYEPYVYKHFSKNDPKILYYLMRSRLRWRLKRLLSAVKRKTAGLPRPPKKVKQNYEEIWRQFEFDDLNPAVSNKPYINSWNDEYQEAHGWGVVRTHLLCLKNLIDILRPRSVLEVGFGRGLNLIALSSHFPEIQFSGIELSKSGFDEATKLANRDELPQQLIDFVPFSLNDKDARSRIKFQQASAESLPFKDNSFDLVYTRQALEQMEVIRPQVLSEIGRVANKNVVMFEAFRDWNETGMCRDRNLFTGYFAARLADLNQYGMNPIFTKSDFPCKAYMRVGLAVTEKIHA